ncbi:MAG: hypothetical protein KVP17_000501, partial [Porospora cf. gigantea B]
KHHGGVTADIECTGLDYPSTDQVVEQLIANQVHPIILIPDDTYTGSLAIFQWLGYCDKATTEADCIVEFYERELGRYPELKFAVAKIGDAKELGALISDKLSELKKDMCDDFFPDNWPTVSPPTPTPTENPERCVVNYDEKCGSCDDIGGKWELTDSVWICYVNDEPIATINVNCSETEVQCCNDAILSGEFGGILNPNGLEQCLGSVTTASPTPTSTENGCCNELRAEISQLKKVVNDNSLTAGA